MENKTNIMVDAENPRPKVKKMFSWSDDSPSIAGYVQTSDSIFNENFCRQLTLVGYANLSKQNCRGIQIYANTDESYQLISVRSTNKHKISARC